MRSFTSFVALSSVLVSSVNAAPQYIPPNANEAKAAGLATPPVVNTVAGSATAPVSTGAVTTTVLAPSIAALPPGPDAFQYPADGKLHAPEPAPYTPSGGLGTNGSIPIYNTKSDFDFESIALALYQEWIELDLFQQGLAQFSEEDFDAQGIGAEQRYLIQFMAEQEIGHATLLTNILGPAAPTRCTYQYPFTTVREFVDFCQKLTRWGESGVYGFIQHLNSREAATLLGQSIATEARQQLIFRQFDGLFPMPVWFEIGVPQSWSWTLLAPYIKSCPSNITKLAWQNFPALTVVNQPNVARIDANATGFNESISSISEEESCGDSCLSAVSNNRTIPLSYPGKQVYLSWETAGQPVGPDKSYLTSTTATAPLFVQWVTQLNTTYTPLMNVSGNTGMTTQPDLATFAGDPAVNGTIFIAITDRELFVTPFNLSMINPHVYAGPAIYQAG